MWHVDNSGFGLADVYSGKIGESGKLFPGNLTIWRDYFTFQMKKEGEMYRNM